MTKAGTNEPDSLGDEISSAENKLLVKQADTAHLKLLRRKIRKEKADKTIKSNVIQAVMLGLIPVPVIDVLALTNVQFKMMDDLVKIYNINYTSVGRSVVKSFILGILPVVTVTGLSSMLKFIPGVGSLVGSASVAVSSGGLTYAVGKVFVQHFERGGTLDDFDLKEAKRQFRQEFSKGKETTYEWMETERLASSSKR